MKKKAVDKVKDAKKNNTLELQKKADKVAQEYNAKYNPSNRVINKGYNKYCCFEKVKENDIQNV